MQMARSVSYRRQSGEGESTTEQLRKRKGVEKRSLVKVVIAQLQKPAPYLMEADFQLIFLLSHTFQSLCIIFEYFFQKLFLHDFFFVFKEEITMTRIISL